MTTRAEKIAAEADKTVGEWTSVFAADREALIARLRNPVVRKYNAAGFGVSYGGDPPIWCADMGAVRRLLLDRDVVAAEVDAARSS